MTSCCQATGARASESNGPGLGIALTESADPVLTGDELDYTIRFGNHGTASVLGTQLVLTLQVELRMPVPSGASGCGTLSDSGTLPTGCAVGRDALWQLGTLAPGAHRSVTFVVRVDVSTAGTLFSAASRVEDAAGSRARASLATPVEPAN